VAVARPFEQWTCTPTPPELFGKKRIDPQADLMSALTTVEVDGEQRHGARAVLVLTVDGNQTTRNLISGAMHAFFQHPDQWERQRLDRTLLPRAVEEMLRYVTPVMNFRRTAMRDVEIQWDKDPRRRPFATRWAIGVKRSSRIPMTSISAVIRIPKSPSGAAVPISALART